MFHVLDHAAVVYTGELSEATQYIIERYGIKLEDASRSGIRLARTEPPNRMNEATQTLYGFNVPDFWKPFEDWMLD